MSFFANILNWLRSKTKQQEDSAPNTEAENPETSNPSSEANFSEMVLAEFYDKNLFDRARTQWQTGDWEGLAKIERESLQHHPQRATLALLAASGHQQRGDMDATRKFTRLAQEWGASKKLVSQMLIAGVYNTLGKASMLCGQQQRALGHFEKRVRTAGIRRHDRHAPDAPVPSEKYAVLALIHDLFKPALYLEIGVAQGKSLTLAACPAVGVDPVPRQLDHLPDTARMVTATSDEFFADMAEHILPHTPDLILLDGMPLLEYLLRDLIHAEALAHSKALIMVPGILPPDPAQATRRRTGPDWNGDIWKLPEILQTHRPDLGLLLLDVLPNGLLLITGLDPTSTILRDKTQEILSAYQSVEMVPEKVSGRSGAVVPEEGVIRGFLGFRL
jgi:hypothetical protein